MFVDINTLAAPIVALLRAVGSGQIPAGGANAVLAASARAIETARITARAAADQMGQQWFSAAADTAADQAYDAQRRAQLAVDNGVALAKNLETAAADVQRAMLDLAAILEHFVTEIRPWATVLLAAPTGLLLILESAADHLRQALVVVERARVELEDRKRELRELMGERMDEAGEGPAVSQTARQPEPEFPPSAGRPAYEDPATDDSPHVDGGAWPTDTGAAGAEGSIPGQHQPPPALPKNPPLNDPGGQPGVTGPIPQTGRAAPAPGTTTMTTPPPTTTTPQPTATMPADPPTAPAPTSTRPPDQPGVIEDTPAPAPRPTRVDQPGVIPPDS
jgi:ElaB/YqjD/DUF883 family membrane-anchored ribosome-binding protein